MSITRDHGEIVFECDAKGCHETLETNTRDFNDAKNMAYEEGWFVRKNDRTGNEWMHFHSQGCWNEYVEVERKRLSGPAKSR